MQRNFSRKGALRGGNKIAQDHAADDTDSHTVESISPLGKVNELSQLHHLLMHVHNTCKSLTTAHKGNIYIWSRFLIQFNTRACFFYRSFHFPHTKMSDLLMLKKKQKTKKVGGAVCGSATLEKQAVGLGSREELGGGSGGGGERLSFRRNSFKRSPQPCNWYLDPRKIFLLCATL